VTGVVATLGEAQDLGCGLTAGCAFGTRDGMKSVRECIHSYTLDPPTLVWTRGREFPLSLLASRLRCPRRGSRRVVVVFQPPSNRQRQLG
jgi:hypothetical protein